MSNTTPNPAGNQAVAVVAPVEKRNELVAYSSITSTDDDAKLKILDAITDAAPIQEHLGEPLDIVDIIIMNTTVTDKQTGEVVDAQRTIIITEDGTAYAAMSGGIIRSINNLIGVFGEPSTWTGPKRGRVVEAGPKGRQYYTMKFGPAEKPKSK